MRHLIKRGEIPNKKEFEDLWNSGYSIKKLTKHYRCSQGRVIKWRDLFGIPERKVGGPNNVRRELKLQKLGINLSKEFLSKEIQELGSYSAIARKYGISRKMVTHFAYKYGLLIDRTPLEGFSKYRSLVDRLTAKIYRDNISIINPKGYPRTRCGVPGGYQLDHIRSVRECYDLGLPIEECAKLSNLQIIPWEDNLARRSWRAPHIKESRHGR